MTFPKGFFRSFAIKSGLSRGGRTGMERVSSVERLTAAIDCILLGTDTLVVLREAF